MLNQNLCRNPSQSTDNSKLLSCTGAIEVGGKN
jgi:hypothetical protein